MRTIRISPGGHPVSLRCLAMAGPSQTNALPSANSSWCGLALRSLRSGSETSDP